ncbi:zinc-binding dehydrogenase [Modestobacter sp. I12A-02628]|uniref:NADP-dependent oxidoreductase n=1 Tax=Goekera deserti TaxID=2497753 RepID=A0A7K3WDB3_9ACTN|nr:NADP-dependent oxidoreductase [Goekera deserti]MPQ96786.1 zinc-binding dehydrogenase [Goekera deserti]NDI46900.1 zinc-binding dehydrogenase [Goekera deserti]NEL54468.1 NADP-dependent oxidoreductase [Goekera deserti]
MRAQLLRESGTDPELADVPVPAVGDDDVLIRVTASSVNPRDLHIASGEAAAYMTYEYPVVLGTDLAGTVERVGAGVSDLAAGDRVFGTVHSMVAGARGSFAELAAAPRSSVVRTPDAVDDESAGALGHAAQTAWQCVEAVAASTGDVVLVHGASGGVGSYAVQVLLARGARVMATARSEPGAELLRSLGAEDVLDGSSADLGESVRDRHPEGIAAIVHLVPQAPAELTALARQVLATGGRVASTTFAAEPDALPGMVAGNVFGHADQAALQAIADLAAAGRLRAPVTRSFPLEQLTDAFAALGGGSTGKIAVRIAAH